jgi:hypothetical protein
MKRLTIMMVALIAVAGCRSITDPVVDYTRGDLPLTPAQAECTKRCDEEYALAMAAANVEHKRIMDEVCWPLPWVDEKPCRVAEHERFRQAKLALYEWRKQCKHACWYNEGTGVGGQ